MKWDTNKKRNKEARQPDIYKVSKKKNTNINETARHALKTVLNDFDVSSPLND